MLVLVLAEMVKKQVEWFGSELTGLFPGYVSLVDFKYEGLSLD